VPQELVEKAVAAMAKESISKKRAAEDLARRRVVEHRYDLKESGGTAADGCFARRVGEEWQFFANAGGICEAFREAFPDLFGNALKTGAQVRSVLRGEKGIPGFEARLWPTDVPQELVEKAVAAMAKKSKKSKKRKQSKKRKKSKESKDDGEVLLRADAPRKRGGGGDDASTVSHAQGAALLELFGHARSCPGRHQSAVHARVCSNAKFIMLHARDCDAAPGTCDVEWCGAVKKLLKHVVRCQQGDKCVVCAAPASTRVSPAPASRPAGKAEAASVLEASGGRPIDYWQSMQGCDGDQCAARNRGKGKDGARRIVG